MPSDTLGRWAHEGRSLVQHNAWQFQSLVQQAEAFAREGEGDMAAIWAEIAACQAALRHGGLFLSRGLERTLLALGRALPKGRARPRATPHSPRHVLHVTTSIASIGGHTRMLWRWMREDAGRRHSLALTRQRAPLLPVVREAVAARGGRIVRLNRSPGGPRAWATALRELAGDVDLVVLHSFPMDVVPLLAFADPTRRPPLLFVNHADHQFWLGGGISHAVANLRHSGRQLAQARRGIPAERNLLLPTTLEPLQRTLPRAEAKRRLGLPADAILLLSVARGLKYETLDGVSYADVHVPLLQKHPRARLLVVGPGPREDWEGAIQRAGGRIHVLGPQDDPRPFFQAADIYVDSFPFVSNTSLIEAGSYGVPLVSRFPYSERTAILGADLPGLDENLLRVRTLEEYERTLTELIEDEGLRERVGGATAQAIVQAHTGQHWRDALEATYARTCALAPQDAVADHEETPSLGEPDVYLARLLGSPFATDDVLGYHLSVMPLRHRVRTLVELARRGRLARRRLGRAGYLLPEWVLGRVG